MRDMARGHSRKNALNGKPANRRLSRFSVPLWLWFRHLHGMGLRPGIVAHATDHPGDLHSGSAACDFELVVLDLLSDVNPRVASDGGELVAEISVERLEPLGHSDDSFALAVEHQVAAIEVHHLRRLDGGVVERLVFRVEGVVDFEILDTAGDGARGCGCSRTEPIAASGRPSSADYGAGKLRR